MTSNGMSARQQPGDFHGDLDDLDKSLETAIEDMPLDVFPEATVSHTSRRMTDHMLAVADSIERDLARHRSRVEFHQQRIADLENSLRGTRAALAVLTGDGPTAP